MRGSAHSLYSLTIRSCVAAGLAIGSAMFAAPGTAQADPEKRIALVIGNGDYKIAPHLDNPPSDARAIAESLRKLGFEVVDGYDLDFYHMRKAVSNFSAALPEAKSAVLYYAGHGVSVDGEDFLLPVDIDLTSPGDLDFSAISVQAVIKQMTREERANIVFLDACRDNPFADALHRNKTRALVGPRGLSPIQGDLAKGTLIAFATDPNSTAQDGVQGGHSPFTEALLNHIEDPGAPIDTVMSRVRTEVYDKTKHTQRPWVNTSLTGEFSFNPQVAALEGATATPAATAAPAATATPATSEAVAKLLDQTAEKEYWESAEHSNLSSDYQAYLDKFPNGRFAVMAKNRIAALSPALTTTRAPDAAPPAGPAGPSAKELKAEIGTFDTEKSLRFGVADKKEIQARLQVRRYYTGPIDGSFNEQTRQAIAEWQKKRQVAPTGMLGPVEVAALRAESEETYQRYLDSQPEKPDAQPENPQATPRVLSYTPSVQTPATGYHYQSYHYHPYHYQPYHYHNYAYHYRRHRHYYALTYGGGGIFSIFSHFGL